MINRPNVQEHRSSQGAVDAGLRQYMIAVYNHMLVGLGITGLVAYLVAQSQTMLNVIVFSPLRWFVLLAPIAIPFVLSMRLDRMRASTAQLLFWVYAGLMGVSLSVLFVIFTGESIARVFFITSSMFGAMSLYGYTTQRDLTAFGSFLMMGLLGLIVASVVNLFLQSGALQFFVSCIGVLIFTGLTAYDVQSIKGFYHARDHVETQSKKAIFGALQLYLDFVNLFVHLLQLMGRRR